jgi:hypothetical protein
MGVKQKLCMSGLILFGSFFCSFADTVVFSGTGQLEDTLLRGDNLQTSAVNNYGGSAFIMIGRLNESVVANSLMRFTALSSLSGHTITNATLRLYNNQINNSQTADVTVDVYEVAAANSDWVEGDYLGTTGWDASDWRFKIQNTSEWAGGQNGCSIAGTDYKTNRVGRVLAVDASGWVEIKLNADVVQNWIDNPAQNCGILLTAPGAVAGEIGYFIASEAAENGPELVLQSAGTLPETPHFSVSSVFSDYMVLQRDQIVPVWGWAGTGTVVNVSLDSIPIATAVPDENGKWTAWIGPHAADDGQAHTLQISADGFDNTMIQNVVFGDVYLASGQSNMATLMSAFLNTSNYPAEVNETYQTEIAAADYPLIRQLALRAVASTRELDEPSIRSPWETCNPLTAPGFSATGYFFARSLHLETGVPVGLLFSAWGGQKIERFFNSSGVESVPELSGMRQFQSQGIITNFYDIYNAMIAPLVPYGIRGTVWYQGEANAADGDLYRYKMQALMRGWRQAWNQEKFSFDYVQLASYFTPGDWPGLREAQRGALSEKDSGMAVAIDIGDTLNIHPSDKQDVGYRLAQWTLARDLQQNGMYSGPLFYNATLDGSSLRILFDHAEGGLIVGNKSGTNQVVSTTHSLENFEIAGSNAAFVAADAVIDADTVLVSSSAVPEPVYVRYCYQSAPDGSNKLYNTEGFPASPFRTDSQNRLDVISGSGSGTVAPGAPQVIVADAPPAGQVFDRWIGAASEVDHLNAASATVIMPDHALYLLATYRVEAAPVYTLTVSSGFGGGTSQAGSYLNIEAAEPSSGAVFDHWSGDTQNVVNVNAAVTTLCMPFSDISMTAVYVPVDTVGDGISDIWRNSYFPSGVNDTANADPDGDGMTNLQEFLAGTSPTNTSSVFRLSESGRDGTAVKFEFFAIAGHRYRLEMTGDLLSNSWAPLRFNVFGDGRLRQMQVSLSATSQQFYRLKTSGTEVK